MLNTVFVVPISSQEVAINGSLVYSYPLNLPPGRNGVAPNLGIVYNSNMGNGMLGMGFALSGLSTITRDRAYAINFNANDHFVLDGQRLVYVSSEDRYHLERENYTLILAFGLDEGTGAEAADSCWVVTLKNGTRMFYGRTDTDHTQGNDGHINAIGKSGKALLWALSRVEDVHGNYYTIDYFEDADNGDYYPLKITWTKGNGVDVYNTIEFYYDSTARTDHGAMYMPTMMDESERLKWIAVKVDGSLYRKYRLDYDYGASSGNSRLLKIVEYGSDGNTPLYATIPRVDPNYISTGSTLPETAFGWSPVSSYNLNINDGWSNSINTSSNGCVYYFADINGDGRDDLI